MSAGVAYQCVGGPLDGDDYVAALEGGFCVRQAQWSGEYRTTVLVIRGKPHDVLLWQQDWQPEEGA